MQNAIVYRSVRMIAEAAASVPLLLYERDARDHRSSAHRPHRPPQPRPDRHRSDGGLVGFLLVSGNGYLEVVAVGGQPRELHALRPDRVKVVPGADGWPDGYEYTAAGQTVRIAGEAVPGVRPRAAPAPVPSRQRSLRPLADRGSRHAPSTCTTRRRNGTRRCSTIRRGRPAPWSTPTART